MISTVTGATFASISYPSPAGWMTNPLNEDAPGIILSYLTPEATWLQAVEKRIVDSEIPEEPEVENVGQWLHGDVVEAALNFFRATSDVLPGEPVIYSANNGDLIADFKASHGMLTSVISPGSVLVYASTDRNTFKKTEPLNADGLGKLRSELEQITPVLSTGRNGSVEPTY